MPTKTGVERVVLMSDSITPTAEYNELLDSIKRTLAAGQLRAARAVNNVLFETYWEIGHDIIGRQQEQGWGAQVIKRLSADLRTAHPDMRGLSARNLHYMAALASRWPTQLCSRLLHNCPGATSWSSSTPARTRRPRSSTPSAPSRKDGHAPCCRR